MNARDWMKLIFLSLKELAYAVEFYSKVKEEAVKGRKPYAVYWFTHSCYIQKAIKRHITQLQQNLLFLGKELGPMTHEQREKLFEIMGRINGLCWGVENNQISEGFCGVAEDLALLLEEDEKDEND